MEQLLEELLNASRPYAKDGKLADYIPELMKADPNALGIFGPALDKNGNSVAGIRLLEEFSHRMYLSIF